MAYRKQFLVILLLLIMRSSEGQPYIDIANASFQHSPVAGIGPSHPENEFRYYSAGLNLPFVSREDSTMIILSPFAEKWEWDGEHLKDLPQSLLSVALPVTGIIKVSGRWSAAATLIPRWNGYNSQPFRQSFQFGAAAVATYKKSGALQYKFGAYYNGEFSGPYFMVLAGLDWKIDERNNLYGLLPGSLNFEHRACRWFYCGALFRSITNTYQAGRTNNGQSMQYVRIQDNQLALYCSLYPLGKVAIDIEGGHSIARKIRKGIRDASPRYFFDEAESSGFIFRATLAYRLRLR